MILAWASPFNWTTLKKVLKYVFNGDFFYQITSVIALTFNDYYPKNYLKK